MRRIAATASSSSETDHTWPETLRITRTSSARRLKDNDSQPLEFLPGVLVRARGREWVVQPTSTIECLRLRPLGGSDEDVVTLIPALEPTPPAPAYFPWPDPISPALMMPLGCCAMRCGSSCAPARGRSARSATLPSSRVHTSLYRC